MTATEDHSKHRIRQELNDVELRFPSRLLYPMDDDKGQAVSSYIIIHMYWYHYGSFSYIPVICLGN